ncbi:unnamed protein product [Tenebrio molitor]|nr:unnamed protein product [Tenebrio molitor]
MQRNHENEHFSLKSQHKLSIYIFLLFSFKSFLICSNKFVFNAFNTFQTYYKGHRPPVSHSPILFLSSPIPPVNSVYCVV